MLGSMLCIKTGRGGKEKRAGRIERTNGIFDLVCHACNDESRERERGKKAADMWSWTLNPTKDVGLLEGAN